MNTAVIGSAGYGKTTFLCGLLMGAIRYPRGKVLLLDSNGKNGYSFFSSFDDVQYHEITYLSEFPADVTSKILILDVMNQDSEFMASLIDTAVSMHEPILVLLDHNKMIDKKTLLSLYENDSLDTVTAIFPGRDKLIDFDRIVTFE